MDLQARLPSAKKTTNVLLRMFLGVDVDATKIMWANHTSIQAAKVSFIRNYSLTCIIFC